MSTIINNDLLIQYAHSRRIGALAKCINYRNSQYQQAALNKINSAIDILLLEIIT